MPLKVLFWEKDIWQTSRFLVAQLIKSMSVVQETWVRSLGREDSSGGRHGIPLQYSHLENPHGQRSLVGYSPEGHKESDRTAATERTGRDNEVREKNHKQIKCPVL